MSAPRILVTDAQDRPGLAAIRCLNAAGYRASATATARWAPGLWSRFCSEKWVVPDPHLGLDDYVAALERVVRQHRFDVLLPGTDETVYAVSTRRQQLVPHVEMGLPAADAVERALDKGFLASAAEQAGIATPDWRICDQPAEALELAGEFGFPLLVKPVRTMVEIDDRLVRYPSRFVLDERGLSEAQQHIGRCIVQRRFPGTMLSFAGVATDRGMLGSVLARYRRTWPPAAGQASFSEVVTAPAALTEQVQALLDTIGWRGVFQLQLIEGDDGTTRAIDFNPRLFGSMGLARAAGVPLAALWSGWLLGEDPTTATAKAGVAYRWEDGDARHVLWQLRHRDYRAAARSAVPSRGTTHPYFEVRDPLPFLLHCAELGKVRLDRALGRRVSTS